MWVVTIEKLCLNPIGKTFFENCKNASETLKQDKNHTSTKRYGTCNTSKALLFREKDSLRNYEWSGNQLKFLNRRIREVWGQAHEGVRRFETVNIRRYAEAAEPKWTDMLEYILNQDCKIRMYQPQLVSQRHQWRNKLTNTKVWAVDTKFYVNWSFANTGLCRDVGAVVCCNTIVKKLNWTLMWVQKYEKAKVGGTKIKSFAVEKTCLSLYTS